MTHLQIKWSTSRGRETDGWPLCTLTDVNTGKRYRTCGGGYDRIGTVLGNWLEDMYQDELRELMQRGPTKPYGNGTMRAHSDLYGMFARADGSVYLDGGCGIRSMEYIAEALGLDLKSLGDRRGFTTGYLVKRAEVAA